ncbi:triose-phosphate isomerase [Spirochaetota bacterium]
MPRKEIFAGNWKMNKVSHEAVGLVKELLAGIKAVDNREVVLFPPSLYVRELIAQCNNSPIDIGIQNMHYEKDGAFTGELSPQMVKDSGCKYILIGHSERRHVFGETNGEVNKKVIAAYENDILPMVCVGELLEERENNLTDEVIEKQVVSAFKDISGEQARSAVIAYEPVWAIGTGKVATPEIAESVHGKIRNLIARLYDEEISDVLPILYGGSVKPDNIEGLYLLENIDGVLVGGASLKSESFLNIINVK